MMGSQKNLKEFKLMSDNNEIIVNEEKFIQLVSLVVEQAGCFLESVDEKQININCPGGEKQELECALAIHEATKNVVFKKKQQQTSNESHLHGWPKDIK